MKLLAVTSFVIIVFLFLFVFMKAWPVFKASGFGLFVKAGFDRQISEAFYAPPGEPMYAFGMFGLIAGTLTTSAISVAIASILGVGGAIAICMLANKKVAYALTALVRLLASIPSVIFGLIGIITVIPWIQDAFVTTELQIAYLSRFQITGRSLLAGTIVVTFMVVPTVISLSVDAIKAVPAHFIEVGYSFGMSLFRVVRKIVLPCARSGVVAGIILATGRAIGESIAVSMVCGGLGVVPDFSDGIVSLLTPVLPLSAAIINKSEAMGPAGVDAALFTCAALLLMIGALLSVASKIIGYRMRKAMGYASKL